MMSQTKTIHERAFALPKGEATTDNPVVPGVKVLGIESKNGRRYPLEVMKNALEKYEGAIVNIDHPAGSEPRSYEDRFGRLTNARMESDGIYADLAYNPKHPLAEGFQWWVKNDPKAIGLSHNAQAKTKMNEQDGVEEIEEIVAVDSVDLVAEPATTAGLLEAVMRKDSESKENKKAEAWTPPKHEKLDMVYNKAHGEFKKIMDEVKKIVVGTSQEKLIRSSSMKLQEFLNELDDASKVLRKTNESAKGNRMNVMEGEIRSSLDSAIRGIEDRILQAYNKLPNIKKPLMDRNAYSEMSQAFGNLYNAFKEFKSKVEQIDKKAPESKPTKKLNVAESKRRKAIRRKLVAEALKEIFSVKKGV